MAPRDRCLGCATAVTGGGRTASVAVSAGAAASREHPVRARVHTVRELTEEAVTLIRNVRRLFKREMSDARRIMWKNPGERTALSAGFSRRTVTRVSQPGAVERARSAGTSERRQPWRRIPQVEYARVRAATYQQYQEKRLSTLENILEVLRGRSGGGILWSSGPR